jgi:uncharacterized protein YrzB (UPF0473 family)
MKDEEIGFDEGEELLDRDVFSMDLGDGTLHDFVMLVVVEHDGQPYALLARSEHLELDDPSKIETIVARVEVDEDGEETVSPIEDRAVYEAVWAVCAQFAEIHESA